MNSIRRAASILSSIGVAFTVLIAVLLAGVRIVGLTPFAILSPSMEPEYPVGSIVYVGKAQPESIEEGDCITYILGDSGMTVTHRVIEADRSNACFYTKGDANNSPDAMPVYYDNVTGVVKFCLPYLGYLSHYLSNPPGMYVGIAVAAALVLIAFLPDLSGKRKKQNAEQGADAPKNK